MAFFKLRKGGEDSRAPAPEPESVETLRRRARHRLVGSALLVLLGVVGFPLMFDTQPRPVPLDVVIDIPDRNKVKPLGNVPLGPEPAVIAQADQEVVVGPAAASALEPKVTPAPAAALASPAPTKPPASKEPASTPKEKAAEKAPAKPVPADKPKPAPEPIKAAPPPERTAAAQTERAPPAKPDEGNRVQALLEGREAPASAQAGAASAAAPGANRFVVQVGAYTDATKLREVRARLERAGLKTYAQVIESKDGKRTRVRLGPFANRAQADAAADKVRRLELTPAILELGP